MKKDKNISYDKIFKELLQEFPDESVVEFINHLFERNYQLNSEVQKLSTETQLNNEEKRSDIMLRIGGDVYHAEIQSNDDIGITLRVFEYSYRAALQHGKTQSNDSLKLRFPKSVVVYLRSDNNTPRELTIELTLPDENTVSFKIPTKHLSEYSLQDLTQDSSVIFAPYYPMRYEGDSLKSTGGLENLKNESILIIDKIKEKLNNGEITQKSADLIIKSLEDILKNTMVKSDISEREVDEIMEAVQQRYQLEPLNWREEGRIEGKVESAKNMFNRGYAIEDIQDITGLKKEMLEKLRLSMPKQTGEAKKGKPSLLGRVEEGKRQSAEINANREKPEKSKKDYNID